MRNWCHSGPGLPNDARISQVRHSYVRARIYLPDTAHRWLIDNGFDETGRAVILDLHGGDLDNQEALHEFDEIKEAVMREVIPTRASTRKIQITEYLYQRESPDRSYTMMWKKYKARVLLAMSAQAFAQLV